MAEIKSIEKRNVVEAVYGQMKALILNGDWKPDSRIPSENELGKLFNVSRNTVRSAIQKLKTMGIVSTNQGQGTFVCRSVVQNMVDGFMPAFLLSKEEILEILEFRKVIEVESVSLAALRADEEDMARLKKSLDRMLESGNDYKEYSRADFQFHLNIAQASKNSIFHKAMIKLEDVLYRHFEEMNRELGPQLSIENHRRIYEAVSKRDPQLAGFLMRENIELSMNKLKSTQ